MEAFSLCSLSIATPKNNIVLLSHRPNWCLLKKKAIVHCHSGGNAMKTGSLAAFTAERSALLNTNNGTAVMDSGGLVLAPNGKEKVAEISVTDLVPFGRPSTSILEANDATGGIGIVNFLKRKTFLITGATGFLGKVLVEKIIRTAPDVCKIYVIIKAKNKEAATKRLMDEILNAELFNSLRQKYGKSFQSLMLEKIVPVVGNVCEYNLGLDEDVAEIIAKEVDVIVNSAANTTFDERYDVSLDINTRGPKRLMSFAKQCQKLKIFMQISTAYVNGQREGKIMEKAFCIGDSIARESILSEHQQGSMPTLDIEEEMKLALEHHQGLDNESVVQKMKQFGRDRANKYGWQDTYVFTKAMGEMMIDKMRGNIPVVIMRPSVIESTYKEPFPGWMEGNRMMDPIILSYGKGKLSGFLVDPNGVLDVVPADMVVNATLAAMAKHGAAGKPETNIYQIASSVVNPLVFQDLATLMYEHFKTSPCLDSKGRPVNVSIMKLFSSKEDLSTHLWQHAINQSGLAASGNQISRKSQKLEYMCRKSVEQAKYLASIYEAYTFYSGRFDNSNTSKLKELMSNEERSQFGFEVENIDWREYISNVHIPGLRRHVMKGRGF
ncbi:hypothetical protein LIER_26678 [Lithospermum erythrorhizon]|uniref:Fatty acyl-CoA reductase n=1 Tax=Lithospermum erythrorhizon TaxID=34254 RepID=A0AAV3R9F9_LITER